MKNKTLNTGHSERLNKDFNYKAIHVGLLADDTGDRLVDKWSIVIEGQTFDYQTGIGHRVRKYGKNSMLNAYRGKQGGGCLNANFTHPTCSTVKGFINHDTKTTTPTIDEVLYCLISDTSFGQETFADFCGNTGYDEDSRKAMDIYLACQKNGDKLHKAGVIDIDKAQEAFSDY